MNRPSAVPWLILALALVLRLAWLPLRPPHSDEGVNGWFAQGVQSSGFYHYDPENYHGPLHYYLLAIAQLLLGRNLWALRLPTVLFGAFACWLVARFADLLGERVAWTAGLFLALSPALVLYARWAIHESEFLFFSILLMRGLLRLNRGEPDARGVDTMAIWQVGIGAAGALVTKEVWIVHAAALLGAWVCWRLTERWAARLTTARVPLPAGEATSDPAGTLPAPAPAQAPPASPARRSRLADAAPTIALVTVVCLGTAALLYAGFGKDPGGIARFFAPYAIWSKRAMQGAGHEKPWHYWLMLFARYEPAALLGLVASPFAALLAPRPLRLLAFYGGGSFVAYTVIHYKTPWCVLEIIWPFVLLAAWAIWRLAARSRPVYGVGMTAFVAVASLVPCVRLNFVHYADAKEPYVYVQTYPEGLRPLRLLEAAARRDPALHQELIHVVMNLSWPLPWMLGDFHQVAHWTHDQLPPGDATVLFVDKPHKIAVEARLHHRYFRMPFVLSPVHPVSYAYFDAARFAGRLPPGTPLFVPPPAPGAVASPTPPPKPMR